MCSSSLAATPLRRCGAAVRMDLISPCCASNSFRAPQPSNSPSLHALQKVMSGWRNCSRFNACLLSGGEFSAMFSKCSRKSSAISGPDKSSIFMSMKNFAPLRIHTTANVRLRSKRLLIRRRRLLTGNRLDPIRCYRAPEADSQFSIQLNQTNFANPIADMSNANFGKITQTRGSAVATSIGTTGGPVGGPRLIQLSLRVQF